MNSRYCPVHDGPCSRPACMGTCQALPSYQECAAKRGFTCILGTGCDRTPVCPRPGCAAQRAHKRGLEEGWNAAIDEAARLLDKQQVGKWGDEVRKLRRELSSTGASDGCFNRVELHEAQCVEGDDLILGGRIIERRRDGTVVRDETHWNLRLLGGARFYSGYSQVTEEKP